MLKTLESRPLLLVSLSFALGLAVEARWGLVLLFVGLLVLFRRLWIALGLGFGLGILLSPGVPGPPPAGELRGLGTVASVPTLGRDGEVERFLLQTEYGLWRVRMPRPPSFGDEVFFVGRAASARVLPVDPLRGIQGELVLSELEIRREGLPWFRWGRAWRESFRDFTLRELPLHQAGLLDALCFNVDAALDPDLSTNLRRSGLFHLVSASGLHVTIFALALQFLFSRLPVPRLVQIGLLLLVLLVYAGAAGFRPPVFRAVVMAGFGLLAYLGRKEPDALAGLGGAILLQGMLDPGVVFDLSFQFSYTVMLALALWPTYPKVGDPWDGLRRGFQTSLVATLAALPLTAFYFGTASLVGIFANLLVTPLMLPLVAGSLLAWAVGVGAVLRGLGLLTEWIVGVAETFGSLPFAAIALRDFPWWAVFVWYAGMLLLWRPARRPAPRSVE